MEFKHNPIQGWRVLRLPLAIIFHAFSVMTPALTVVYAFGVCDFGGSSGVPFFLFGARSTCLGFPIQPTLPRCRGRSC
jgi:hypothetical protein